MEVCIVPFFFKQLPFILFIKFIYLFIYFWLCWVFVSVPGLSPVAASGGHSSSRCVGLSLSRPLLLRSTGSRRTGSVVVAHGPSCSAAWDLPRPGLEPVSPALAGRFSTTAPPGKPCIVPFDDLHPIPPPFLPYSGNHKSDLFFYEFSGLLFFF